MKNALLNLLLQEGTTLDTQQMAKILGKSDAEIEVELKRLRDEKVLLGWRPVFNPDAIESEQVRAVIEVKISPEREGGFDRLAARISRFEAVESCYLVSGGYDLLAFVKGNNLREVAAFISERLSTIEGVLSTSTHFMLRAYKEQGFLLDTEALGDEKPSVSP